MRTRRATRAARLVFVVLLLVALVSIPVRAAPESYDLIIENGRVVDGTGNPWYYADIGIRDGRIAAIRDLEEAVAGRRIDATGMVVAPGFIDTHTHADSNILELPLAENYVRQGVTTVVGGNCGGSIFPVDQKLAEADAKGLGINFGLLIGHGTIRQEVMGMSGAAPTAEEMEKMKALVAAAMEAGALGMSTGLFYAPGSYAKTEEVVELAKVVARYGGIYVSHIRDETRGLFAAVKEAVAIGEQAGIPVHISHFKCLGKPVWNQSAQILNLVDEARRRGVDVTFDQYPYTAGSTSVAGALIPRWAQEGGEDALVERLQNPMTRAKIRAEMLTRMEEWGGANAFFVAKYDKDPRFEGKNLEELGKEKGMAPVDVAIDMQIGGGGSVVLHSMLESDVRAIMQSPYGMIGSDGGLVEFGKGVPHPRYYGTFPRVLGRYVREEGLLSLEEAIRKMTSAPANRLGLVDRGTIREGMVADIVVFDPATVKDQATFEKPHQYPVGISYVLVNGQVVIQNGVHTGKRAGRVLYRQRSFAVPVPAAMRKAS